MSKIYIAHSPEKKKEVTDCASLLSNSGNIVKLWPYEKGNTLKVKDKKREFTQTPGLVFLLGNVKGSTERLLLSELGGQNVTKLTAQFRSGQELFDILCKNLPQDGQDETGTDVQVDIPIAKDIDIALRLIGKLLLKHCWGGNDKKYLYAHDLPNGSGLDKSDQSRLTAVLSILIQEGLLKKKKTTSSGKQGKKYALNHDKQKEINSIWEKKAFPPAIQKKFASEEMTNRHRLNELDRRIRNEEGAIPWRS